MVRVALYIPPGVNFTQVSNQLHDFCSARNYQIVSIDRDGKPWWDTLITARQMGIDVILVADETHLPEDRTPRVEVADLSLMRPDLPGNRQDHIRKRKPRPQI